MAYDAISGNCFRVHADVPRKKSRFTGSMGTTSRPSSVVRYDGPVYLSITIIMTDGGSRCASAPGAHPMSYTVPWA
ncbi:hypothetical protein HZ326_29937, partial [Fusarium oxysporum f. sp. albedinis]